MPNPPGPNNCRDFAGSVTIDTFNPKAAKAYERQGYWPFRVLPDFPVGRSRVFLQKKLLA